MNKKIIQTTKCEKQFACLTNEINICCKVVKCIGKSVCFIDDEAKNDCNYKICYGDSMICSCPVRIELHNEKLKNK